jgi:hypothetical protein
LGKKRCLMRHAVWKNERPTTVFMISVAKEKAIHSLECK